MVLDPRVHLQHVGIHPFEWFSGKVSVLIVFKSTPFLQLIGNASSIVGLGLLKRSPLLNATHGLPLSPISFYQSFLKVFKFLARISPEACRLLLEEARGRQHDSVSMGFVVVEARQDVEQRSALSTP